MTSKERVARTLLHKEPDRVPFDLSGTLVTGIHWQAYERLRDYLGLPARKTEIWDVVQGLARCEEDLLARLNVDTRGILFRGDYAGDIPMESNEQYEQFVDYWGITWRRVKPHGLYFDIARSPLAEMDLGQIKAVKWADPKNERRMEGFREQARQFAGRDCLVMLGTTGWTAGLLQQFQWLLGYERAFYSLAGEPKLADYLIGTLAELDVEFWDWAIPYLGPEIAIVLYADDYGLQNGPVFSHEMFERFFKPRYRRIFTTIKKNGPHLRIFFHSCGASRFIIPDLIELGVDILNPIQVSARGMDTRELKREFGQDLVFWGGGVDTQHVLPHGTAQQVREEVRRRIDDLAPGGGFVFNTVHNIQADVPPQNVVAMWETLQEHGKY